MPHPSAIPHQGIRRLPRILLCVCVLTLLITKFAPRPAGAADAPHDETTVAHGDEEGTSGHAPSGPGGGSHGLIHQMMLLAFQLGIMIIAAKVGGELFHRFLKQPAVLGELASGLLIGPYALGALPLPILGPLFPPEMAASDVIPVSAVVYGFAVFASIILLFLAGLETNFQQFLRYAGPGGLVGAGGVLGAFLTGDLLYVLFSGSLGHGEATFMSPMALFMGTISVATSVGITARVLSDEKKLDTPEGTTIIAGAVIDDVLGIIVLAIVLSLAKAGGEGGVDWATIGAVAGKAFGFWLVATAVGIAAAGWIRRLLGLFHGEGVVPGLALGLALLLSGLMESVGLAMIIGAYVMGLSLSREKELARRLEHELRPIYAILVPVFFCVMGMLVDFNAMGGALAFGLLFSVVAVVAKVIGCGLPTYLVGFNTLGALRVGFGMLPRGEVALIVAGVGLAAGVLPNDMFGVSILMTLVTTVAAPPALVVLFRNPKSGLRHSPESPKKKAHEEYLRTKAMHGPQRRAVLDALASIFQEEGFQVAMVSREPNILLLTGDQIDFEVVEREDHIAIQAEPADRERLLPIVEKAFQTLDDLTSDLLLDH